MCGIAGILGRLDEGNTQALRRMSRALNHRGPDAEGFWTGAQDDRGQGCMLAHRRLSILDLSNAAAQPMTDPRGRHTLTFNGETYNYVDLRNDLTAAGETFQSTGDTAVMLRLLALQGNDAVSKLRGMFAFGLWDASSRELMLARDPLGIKPLYVCRNPDPSENQLWSLIFASEVRAILASGLMGSPKLDPAAVASMVWNGFVMGPGTAVRGIESLMPGEYRVFDDAGNQKTSKRYWTMPSNDGPPAGESDVRQALAESVRLHLASDVPMGVFLSGGIDSSAVANLAQRTHAHPINTFTLAFEESEYDESHHARAVADAIGTHHSETVLTEQSFVRSLGAAMDSLDQPSFDGLNSYYISKAVREAGLTVALVGTGGDELFGGYNSFRHLPRLQRLARQTGWAPAGAKITAAKLLAAAVQRGRGPAGAVRAQTRWAKLPEMVRAGDDLAGLYQLSYALFLPDFQSELLNGSAAQSPLRNGLTPAMQELLARETAGRSGYATISVLEQRCFLGERLLRDTDAASMSVSLETRLPLVDTALLETVCRLPDSLRFEPVGRKQVLRSAALAGLDPKLFERPKRGFVMPFDRWIRQTLGREMDAAMRDSALCAKSGLNGGAVLRLWDSYQSGTPGLYWSRIWAIYTLLRWCDRHGVGI